jgi:hypothetical protein
LLGLIQRRSLPVITRAGDSRRFLRFAAAAFMGEAGPDETASAISGSSVSGRIFRDEIDIHVYFAAICRSEQLLSFANGFFDRLLTNVAEGMILLFAVDEGSHPERSEGSGAEVS